MKFFRHRLWIIAALAFAGWHWLQPHSRAHGYTPPAIEQGQAILGQRPVYIPIRARIVCNAKANWNGSRTDSARANGLPGALTHQKWPGRAVQSTF
jgi:hypothetical protein